MKDAQARLQAVIAAVPYARFLRIRMDLAGDEMTAVMPYCDELIGNPMLAALHGGVLGAFMEMTALAQLCILHPVYEPEPGDAPPEERRLARQPRPIGVTVEYLRAGRRVDTFARAQVKRAGRRVAIVAAEAWQDKRSTPIALLSARFLLSTGDAGDGSHPVQPQAEQGAGSGPDRPSLRGVEGAGGADAGGSSSA